MQIHIPWNDSHASADILIERSLKGQHGGIIDQDQSHMNRIKLFIWSLITVVIHRHVDSSNVCKTIKLLFRVLRIFLNYLADWALTNVDTVVCCARLGLEMIPSDWRNHETIIEWAINSPHLHPTLPSLLSNPNLSFFCPYWLWMFFYCYLSTCVVNIFIRGHPSKH